MADLAPGRTFDMAMLLERRASATKYTSEHYRVQNKIDDLLEEGKCNTVCRLRARLVGASIAHDNDEVEKISRLIEAHVQSKHPKRHYRSWGKKG